MSNTKTIPLVVMLASGKSSRMWPLQNKTEIPLMGKSLLERQLSTLREQGYEKVVLVSREELLERHQNMAKELSGLDIEVVVQTEEEGMIRGGLRAALEVLPKDTPLLLMNSNDVVQPSLLGDLRKKEFSTDMVVVGQERESYFPGGYLVTNEEGMLWGIDEKPGEGNEPSSLVNIFLHLCREKEVLRKILSLSKEYEDGMDECLRNGDISSCVHSYQGFWQALKYPWHLLDLLPQVLTEVKSHIPENLDPSVVIQEEKGKVFIHPSATIYPQNTIMGPCYIGEEVVLGSYSLIRESIVEKNCLIGSYSEVTRSHLHPRVELHKNYVGDSVLGEGTHFGAGAITTNKRLDGKVIHSEVKGVLISTEREKFGAITGEDVKLGSTSVVYPGRKMGSLSVGYPQTVITKDLKELERKKSGG